MSYTVNKNEIVFSGFEDGISDNPYKGINDMRGVNIVSIPGEACVSFAQSNVAPQPLVGTIISFNNNVITPNTTTGSITDYIAVQFTTTGTLPTGISLATTYWVRNNGGGTMTIYADCYLITQTTFTNGTGSGTHTFTSLDMGAIRYFERNYGFAIDENGRCWTPTSGVNGITYSFMNNTITNGSGNGLCIFKGSGATLYLYVFRNGQIDYVPVTNVAGGASGIAPVWVTGWNPTTGATTAAATLQTATNTNNPHEAMISTNNFMYFVDASFVGSLNEVPGQTFDPTNTATYTFNGTALALPKTDTAQCIEQLGNNMLIGGLYNNIYPWDRLSSAFNYPILIAEKMTTRIITVNTNAYIFAGRRGRIFVTNGSQAQLFKKMPDFLLGIDPAYTFYGVGYNKNQLYFGVSAKTNAGTIGTTYAGLWAVDLDTKALRATTLQSTSTATVTAMWSNPNTTTGFGLQTAWKTVNGSDITQTAGIDTATSAPYTTYVSYINTDIVPVGQFLKLQTFNNIEFKLSAPLVSGEGIKILYRTNLTEAFAAVASTNETTTVGAISDVYTPLTFQNVQWIQLQVQMKSTASSPSYVRLVELRIRANP